MGGPSVGFRGWEGTQVRSGGAHSSLTLTAKIAMSLCGLGPLQCPQPSVLGVGSGSDHCGGQRGREVWVQTPAQPIPSCQTRASCLASLSLSLVICKTGMTTHLLHRARAGDAVGRPCKHLVQ